jgi:hypothetical protein
MNRHRVPPTRWSRRFLDTVPPMPDWLWVTILGVLLFLAGMAAGVTLCQFSSAPTPASPTMIALQEQLQRLDQRVRALEQR